MQNKQSGFLAAADLCVKCGLCLPYCPTYNKTRDENESPRGRIELMQAWASHSLPNSLKLRRHIDNCLLCRSCERICPAGVPYARLVDDFRSKTKAAANTGIALSLLRHIVHSRRLSQVAGSAINYFQLSGLRKTGLVKLPGLKQLDRLLPEVTQPQALLREFFAAEKAARAELGLFVGCMGPLLDSVTVNAAIRVLNVAGFNVHIPPLQTCCGALDLHAGDKKTAGELAEKNIAAFSALEVDQIITIGSGCGATLQEYDKPDFANKIVDICEFLYRENALRDGCFKTTPITIAVHTPCSLQNVMRQEQGVIKILEQIPGLQFEMLSATVKCCGSAGSYMLEHPQMAAALRDDLLQAAGKRKPEILVTSNIGCALHISAGCKQQGMAMEVIHPIVFIDRLMH